MSRISPLEMSPAEFRKIGHKLVDDISVFLETIRSLKVNPAQSPEQVKSLLREFTLPVEGESPEKIVAEAADLLLNNSLLNGHPAFFGYITSSAAPIGALG